LEVDILLELLNKDCSRNWIGTYAKEEGLDEDNFVLYTHAQQKTLEKKISF
jgi:hypothetical protein